MRGTAKSWPASTVILAGGGVCMALTLAGIAAPKLLRQPLLELLKLIVAALLGLAVTAVHKRYHKEQPLSRSLEQAQVLLCISGAMMMIIIGDSLARAFGIAGAASIIRFRTPVEDPKDTILLFLLLGLGMSCGLGAFGVSALAAAFLCLVLAVMDRMGARPPRSLLLEMVAAGPEFPAEQVRKVLDSFGVTFEPREVQQGTAKYRVSMDPALSLQELSARLMQEHEAGVRSVSWGRPRRGKDL